MDCCHMIHSLLKESIEMLVRRLVQQISLLATGSLILLSLLLLIRCFVHSQLLGHSYLNCTKSVASWFLAQSPPCRGLPEAPGQPGDQFSSEVLGMNHWRLLG